MRFRVLGSLAVWDDDGAEIALRGAPPRALLCLLLLRRGRAVSRADLVEALWGRVPPASPAAALQVVASRLRGALGSARSRVVSEGSGYRIDVLPDEVDLVRAEMGLDAARHALRQERPVDAVVLAERALAEWVGTPLVEFDDVSAIREAADHIGELKLELIELRNDGLLVTGRAAEVLDDIDEHVRREPWRERLRAQQMLALYAGGRQVEALAVYDDLRAQLAQRFGTAPHPDLQATYLAILRHDQSLLGGPPLAVAHRHDPRDAFQQVAGALSRVSSDASTRARLLAGLAEAQHGAGDPSWHDTLLRALDLAGDDAGAVADVVSAAAPGWTFRRDAALVRSIERALAALSLDDHGPRARLLSVLAANRMVDEDPAARWEMAADALRAARRSADPQVLLFVLLQRLQSTWWPGSVEERVAESAEAVELADQVGDSHSKALAHGRRMACALEVGELRESDRSRRRLAALARATGSDLLLWSVPLHGCWRAVIDGDLDLAETRCHEARAMGEAAGRSEAEAVFVSQLSALRWAQGRLGEVVDLLDAALSDAPFLVGLRPLAALARLRAGSADDARGFLLDQASRGFVDLPRDSLYLAALGWCVELASELGDREAAATLQELLTPWSRLFVFTGSAVFGPVAVALARAAATVGRDSEAAEHRRAARRLAERMPSPFFVGRIPPG